MKIFPKNLLVSGDIEKEIFNFMKNNSTNGPIHVIFLSNRTNNFEKYENKLYAENLTEIEKFTEKYGLSSKKEASLDHNLVKKYLKYMKFKINKIKYIFIY